ncbi:MAG TPA: hypothetical protein VIL72_14330, partial [Beijerinckiaceae bacterium]
MDEPAGHERRDAATRDAPEEADIAAHCRRAGHGPPIVWLHPHIGLHRSEAFLAALARRGEAIHAPCPGFDHAPRPAHF